MVLESWWIYVMGVAIVLLLFVPLLLVLKCGNREALSHSSALFRSDVRQKTTGRKGRPCPNCDFDQVSTDVRWVNRVYCNADGIVRR